MAKRHQLRPQGERQLGEQAAINNRWAVLKYDNIYLLNKYNFNHCNYKEKEHHFITVFRKLKWYIQISKLTESLAYTAPSLYLAVISFSLMEAMDPVLGVLGPPTKYSRWARKYFSTNGSTTCTQQ